jgi:hypothetical protein
MLLAMAFKAGGALLANLVAWIGKYPKRLIPYSRPRLIWLFSYPIASASLSVAWWLLFGRLRSGFLILPFVFILGELLEEMWERLSQAKAIGDIAGPMG